MNNNTNFLDDIKSKMDEGLDKLRLKYKLGKMEVKDEIAEEKAVLQGRLVQLQASLGRGK